MCRLFGCRTASPGGVAHELLHGANALRIQSREHPDGWGLGWYLGRVPQVVRSLSPAHGDEDFEEVGSFVSASTIVAHLRKASVGGVSEVNTHPFEWGPWLFAHNGTIPAWDRIAAPLEALIEPGLRAKIRGETDSERCFYLFLTRLAGRCDPTAATFADAAAALSEAASLVRRAARDAGQETPSTTFLATDGRLMIACRRGRTLHVSAPEPDPDGRVGYFAVASEDPKLHQPVPPGRAPWRAVLPDAIVGVDADLRLCRASLAGS
jgi:predicted glutamine amidotransferase